MEPEVKTIELTDFDTSICGQKRAGPTLLERAGLGDSGRNLRRKKMEKKKMEEEYVRCLKIEVLFKRQQVCPSSNFKVHSTITV